MSLLILALGDARRPIDRPIRLADLVPSTDALARQDLRFDARFASAALAYARTSDPAALEQAVASPAARHIIDRTAIRASCCTTRFMSCIMSV